MHKLTQRSHHSDVTRSILDLQMHLDSAAAVMLVPSNSL